MSWPNNPRSAARRVAQDLVGINVYRLTELSLARQFAVGFGKEATVPAIS